MLTVNTTSFCCPQPLPPPPLFHSKSTQTHHKMALNLSQPPPLTIFSPPPLTPTPKPSTTQLNFSRWNNANAEKFTLKKRQQEEIEAEIRRERRFTSATKIVETAASISTANANDNFRSIGTPSSPSRPSIPGKKSKYTKSQDPTPNPNHPAFSRVFKTPKFALAKLANQAPGGVQVGETGVTYKVPNAPFEYQYSYTETPKVKPLALREPPFVPFGPTTMPRPWTGRAPLPASKKKLPEFDSFRLPPPHKKGVKPVQAPGPFLAGMGPRYVRSREEVLGEPLTEEEIKELIQSCLRTRRQLNMGRDGFTHNMLDNIHAHWKRRRVCKIKCKGVCTVDMDNVRHQLEEKTGGKIIYSRGGVLFLFRGRNYNYRSRPRFPLMLWKPVTPVYPRLVQRAPEGLTLEEAREMRKRGRGLPPICKLGKNGVYTGLVKHVKEAFEVCELVRIDCEGMNASDFKKIGAKLKDLVPCVLVSFERENILLWRGPNWQSSNPKLCESSKDGVISSPPDSADGSSVEQGEASQFLAHESKIDFPDDIWSASDNEGMDLERPVSVTQTYSSTRTVASVISTSESSVISDSTGSDNARSVTSTLVPSIDECATTSEFGQSPDDEPGATSAAPEQLIGTSPALGGSSSCDDQTTSPGAQILTIVEKPSSVCTEGILLLQKKAVESGSALILDDVSSDADTVYRRSVTFARGAPPGPVFRHMIRKVLVRKRVKQESSGSKEKEYVAFTEEVVKKKSFKTQKLKAFKDVNSGPLPHGSLGVDELAKLLG